MQDHMLALTELRQYVRAEQNRPVLGASRQNQQQGGGPGMGNLGSLLSSLMGGQAAGGAGGGGGQEMMQKLMPQVAGGVPGGGMPQQGVDPAGQEQEGVHIPGSKRKRRRRKGGMVPMPGMGNYPALMGGAGF